MLRTRINVLAAQPFRSYAVFLLGAPSKPSAKFAVAHANAWGKLALASLNQLLVEPSVLVEVDRSEVKMLIENCSARTTNLCAQVIRNRLLSSYPAVTITSVVVENPVQNADEVMDFLYLAGANPTRHKITVDVIPRSHSSENAASA